MKKIKIFLIALFFAPISAFAVSDFQMAAQLLAAAKNADIGQVQALVNNGANVNYVDNTGLSIVCTALMNNDVRAAQILQMYGADASRCDQQIKKYNQKKPKTESGGLFSGLSQTQSLALAAAGAAVVVGGVLLVTDLLDDSSSGGGGSSGSTGGGTCNTSGEACTCANGNTGTCTSRGTCDCSGTGGGKPEPKFSLPYGPAMPNKTSEDSQLADRLDYYSPETGVLKDSFTMMSNSNVQNYLLLMHGYSPLARGYMGMRTLRGAGNTPILPEVYGQYKFAGETVMGGRPVNVALVTENGIDTSTDSSLGDRLMAWTEAENPGNNTSLAGKYYNNIIEHDPKFGDIRDYTTTEDVAELPIFDLSGSGTAINNSTASDMDNLLAKIITGKDAGYTNADFIGFMPNGQLTVFRTGGGSVMKNTDGTTTGAFTDAATAGLADDDKVVLGGKDFNVTLDPSGDGFVMTRDTDTYFGYIGTNGLLYVDIDDDGVIDRAYTIDTTSGKWVLSESAGYVGADGLLYIDSDGDGTVDQAYNVDAEGGTWVLAKELKSADYHNYKALLTAGLLWRSGDQSGGKSRPDIIANADVITPLHDSRAATISDLLSFKAADRKGQFENYVNDYYDADKTDDDPAGDYATAFFNNLGKADGTTNAFSPLVIFSTGAFKTNSSVGVALTENQWAGETLEATFENAAPIIFTKPDGSSNLEHLFMSAVAVGMTGGTNGATSVSGYSPSGKFTLAQWSEYDEKSDTYEYYKARRCGVSGTGANGIDPWCFAAVGLTDELAVASLAGAAGSLKSAFSYLNNKQIFALLALTADGPYLGSDDSGKVMTVDALRKHLESMYLLPNEYNDKITSDDEYFKAFKEVYGYGLVNLERATKPGTSVYYYNGSDIVSGSGNAYWRSATATKFNTSGAFSLGGKSISAPFYDVLESADGSLYLTRIWENEFNLGAADARGLYMGDVLGDMKVTKDEQQLFEFGNMSFGMSFSNKAYVDNLGGLDNLQFGYKIGDLSLTGQYQRHFTDGESRFTGSANPILSLASNTISSDAEYKMGNWMFGARAFSGAITDEGLLENDPTASSQYEPAKLGMMQGAQASMGWGGNKFKIMSSVGSVHETNTVLGAYTDGLLSMGNGDTTYADVLVVYKPTEDLTLSMRSTFAKTRTDAAGEFILGLSDLESNAFSAGVDYGNWSFAASLPLAVTSGNMQYAYADYESVENDDGNFDLVIKDTHVADLNLGANTREVRLSGAYRHQFGEFTNGAFGFIYRINPNHVKEFGNESIFMFKLQHKLGI